jgi:hypothetical protein
MSINNIDSFASVSDAFCWRTDNDFSTIFKYSDILLTESNSKEISNRGQLNEKIERLESLRQEQDMLMKQIQ